MKLRRGLRYLRATVMWALAIVVIGTAVIVALGRLAAPHADRLRPWVEDYLSERMRQPVDIARIEARWPRLLPRITLEDVTFGGHGRPGVHVDRLYLEGDPWGVVTPGRNPVRLVLAGITGDLTRQDNGRWRFGLFGTTGLQLDPRVLNLGDFNLVDSEVYFRPYDSRGVAWRVEAARIQRNGPEVSIVARAAPAGRATGRAELRARLTMDDDRIAALEAWTELDRIALTAAWPSDRVQTAAPGDRVSGQVWWQWRRGGDLGARGRFSWSRQNVETLFPRQETRSVRVGFEGLPGDWRFEAALETRGDAYGRVSAGRRDQHWALRADDLDLATLQPWVRPWLNRAGAWPAVTGRVPMLEIAGRGTTLTDARGRIRALAVAPGERTPGIGPLEVDLGIRQDRLLLDIKGEAPSLTWPGMLRSEIELDALRARVLAAPGLVEIEQAVFDLPAGTVTADGFVGAGSDGPFLDLQARFPRLETDSPGDFYPVGVMPPEAVAWLDRAIAGGVVSGRMQIFGETGRWPWAEGQGVFQVEAVTEDVRLAFLEDWPAADVPRAELAFRGQGMDIRAQRARIGGLEVEQASASIDNLLRPVLNLDFADDVLPADDLREVLLAAPLDLDGLADLDLDGRLGADIALRVPLIRDGGRWTLTADGEARSVNVRHVGDWFALDAVTGSLQVTRERLVAPELVARLGADPVQLSLEAGREHGLDVALSGMLGLPAVLPRPWRARLPESLVAAVGEGRAEWHLAYRSPPDAPAWALTLTSPLAGLGLNLPAPLAKPPGSAWPLSLTLNGRDTRVTSVRGGLEDRLTVAMDDRGQGRRGIGLRLGPGPARAPAEGDFSITGEARVLDAGGWLKWAARWSAAGAVPAGGGDLDGTADLRLGALRLGARDVPDVNLELARGERHWRIDLGGEAVSGEIRLPAADAAGAIVVADFQRLHLGEKREKGGPAAPTDAQPGRLPALHLLVEDLRAGDLALGRLRLESHRVDNGLEVELLQTEHPDLQISGRGRWLGETDASRSEFDLRLTTPDLGQVLADAGYGLTIEGASAVVGFEARWPGAPTDMAAGRVRGHLDLDIRNGRIPEASPGAGRMLGLISLTALPRRLRLDFSDVFGEGFAFDRIHGRFELGDGLALIDRLQVEAPAANLDITGRTDLVARTYDQMITVRPGLGSTLPVLGALAGGPGGAAAGLALQGLLQRPLRDLAEVRYRVTGPWREPEIILIDATAREPETGNDDPDNPPSPVPPP